MPEMYNMRPIKKIRQLARELKLTHLPLITLYGQPVKTFRGSKTGVFIDVKKYFPKVKHDHFLTDVELTISIYLHVHLNLQRIDKIKKLKGLMDSPTFIQEYRFGRTKNTCFLAPHSKLYIEHIRRKAAAHLRQQIFQLLIYADNNQHCINIAKLINQLHGGAAIENIDWQRIEKKLKINTEDCIATWKNLLE